MGVARSIRPCQVFRLESTPMPSQNPRNRRSRTDPPTTADNTVPNRGPQNRASNVSLHPLTMDQAVDAIFAIKPADVKRVLASKPGRKHKGKGKA